MDRNTIINKRMDLSSELRRTKEKAIVETLLPFLKGKIAAYVPIRGEVDVFSYLEGYDVYLPKVIDSTRMEFIKFDNNCRIGSYGIVEPEGDFCDSFELDVILVPMVSFSHLTRKGYGKGYYDRYLKNTRALKIGIAFDLQEDLDIKKQVHDVDMDMIITETRRIV